MSSSIRDFKSAILKNKGFARSNRFKIQITDIPGSGELDTRDLNFLCETVNIPSKQINTIEYDRIGMARPLKIPTGYTEDDVTMNFNLTNNYVVKTALDSWMEKIININSYLLSYDAEYKRDIAIAQLDESDGVVYAVQLVNAYPISIGSIDLDNGAESSISKVTVVFTYDELKINPTSGSSVQNATIDTNDFGRANINLA
jgi:hypothetical protein